MLVQRFDSALWLEALRGKSVIHAAKNYAIVEVRRFIDLLVMQGALLMERNWL